MSSARWGWGAWTALQNCPRSLQFSNSSAGESISTQSENQREAQVWTDVQCLLCFQSLAPGLRDRRWLQGCAKPEHGSPACVQRQQSCQQQKGNSCHTLTPRKTLLLPFQRITESLWLEDLGVQQFSAMYKITETPRRCSLYLHIKSWANFLRLVGW